MDFPGQRYPEDRRLPPNPDLTGARLRKAEDYRARKPYPTASTLKELIKKSPDKVVDTNPSIPNITFFYRGISNNVYVIDWVRKHGLKMMHPPFNVGDVISFYLRQNSQILKEQGVVEASLWSIHDASGRIKVAV